MQATSTIRISDLPDYQGEDAWRIETPAAIYVFHKHSAGFASLIDPDGADWISFRPGGGSAGEYRGIPNLGREQGAFHPGRPGGCHSWIESRGTDAVVIRSETDDGLWATAWTISENRADLLVERTGHPYWFLYEGTPGGDYDEDDAYLIDSGGERRSCGSRWEMRLPEPRWAYFATPRSAYALLIADRTERPPETVDSYWSMERNMTVFGLGRTLDHDSGRWMHLGNTPSRFTVALLPRQAPQAMHSAVDRLLGAGEY